MQIKANNKEIEVSGLVLDFSAGGIVLSFSIKDHIKELVKLYNQSLVECVSTSSTTGVSTGKRVFLGRVRSVRRAEGGGLWNVVVWDFKKEMFDIPFFGRSLQKRDDGNRKRWATVKYAFTKEDVSEGELYYWTVGAMLQDVINQMCGETGDFDIPELDGLPTFYDYFPEEIVDSWKYNYSSDNSPAGEDWRDNWPEWIDSARQTTAAHPFSELDRKPWGVQFSGEKVGTVINNILNRYYPSYNWWINPQTMLIEIVKTYELEPEEHETFDSRKRLYLVGLAPVLENCFTRVIMEGQNSEYTLSYPGYKDGFINSDAPMQAGKNSWLSPWTDPPSYATKTESGIDMETYFSSYGKKTAGGDGTDVLGYYYKDTRDIFDTATDFPDKYRGAAFEKFGIKRTMLLIDNELGHKVYVTPEDEEFDPNDPDGSELVDRSQGMIDLCEEILGMLSAVRYTGKLEIKDSPFINPFQRITIKNHPLHGTITFSPQSMRWEDKFGFRSYTLGDNKYNPLEEFKLMKQLKWRDKEDPRKREPKVLKT